MAKQLLLSLLILLGISPVSFSQVRVFSQVAATDIGGYGKKHRVFKKYAEQDFVLVGGTFLAWRFEGADSLNLKSDEKKCMVTPVYIAKREVSIADYKKFYQENNGVFEGISLKPVLEPGSWTYSLSFERLLDDPELQDYPITGVSKNQAAAYCKWLGQKFNKEFNKDEGIEISGRLPMDVEFQLAEIRDFNTLDKVNSKLPVPVETYTANSHFKTANFTKTPRSLKASPQGKVGFYNIAGNVAEWTLDTPNDRTLDQVHNTRVVKGKEYAFKISRSLTAEGVQNLGIVKGGSFDSDPFYLQPGVISIADIRRGYRDVGFRPVLQVLEKTLVDNQAVKGKK